MSKFYSPSQAGFFDTEVHAKWFEDGVPNGPIVDAVAVTPRLHKSLLIANRKGKTIKMGNKGLPVAVLVVPTAPEKWISIRRQRNSLLVASDWTQVVDFPGDQTGWARYRQLLRDIPQDYAPDPGAVIWPKSPA